jgi:hypothetical protein
VVVWGQRVRWCCGLGSRRKPNAHEPQARSAICAMHHVVSGQGPCSRALARRPPAAPGAASLRVTPTRSQHAASQGTAGRRSHCGGG